MMTQTLVSLKKNCSKSPQADDAMGQAELTVTMALSGAPVAADLTGVSDVTDVRVRVANACGVRPEQVELFHGAEKIDDGTSLLSKPFLVVINQGVIGHYRSQLAVGDREYTGMTTVLVGDDEYTCGNVVDRTTVLPFAFEINKEGMVLNGVCGEMAQVNETYIVNFPVSVTIGYIYGGKQSRDTPYNVTGCELNFQFEGHKIKTLTGKFQGGGSFEVSMDGVQKEIESRSNLGQDR